MYLHLYQSELGLAGCKKDLSHRIIASHKPYSGEQHLLCNKVMPSFQCPDKRHAILQVIQMPLN